MCNLDSHEGIDIYHSVGVFVCSSVNYIDTANSSMTVEHSWKLFERDIVVERPESYFVRFLQTVETIAVHV